MTYWRTIRNVPGLLTCCGTHYKNDHHSWELRHDFGIDVSLFWYVGLQVTHPTWRLEGPEGSYHLQVPDTDRERFREHSAWELTRPDESAIRDVVLTIRCADTPDPTQEPSEQPTEEPTQQPSEQPTEEPTEQPTEEPTEEPTP